MRKLFFGALAALFVLGVAIAPVKQAQACDGASCVGEFGADSVGEGILKGAALGLITFQWLDKVIIGAVYRDIQAGGLSRKYAEAVPGAGYQVVFNDMTKITPQPAFTAKATNIGDETRQQLIASFATSMSGGPLYAAVR